MKMFRATLLFVLLSPLLLVALVLVVGSAVIKETWKSYKRGKTKVPAVVLKQNYSGAFLVYGNLPR